MLVQMNLPFCSPLRWYSIIPWLLTRIVPSGLDALLMSTCAAGCVLAAKLVVLPDELLPQAAISSDAAIAGKGQL